jgi:MOSC domain-containing protein YiiM/ferredoxin-NADP reductase
MAVSSWIPPPRPDPETLRNPPPFEPFPLGQIRSGKIKKSLGNGRIETAIFKTNVPGPVVVTENGIIGDEHAYEPHRSPDKALLHYCTSHYDAWSRELPASEAHFKPGAFGENIFSAEVSERNVCIGDRIAIGDIIVEVTEPRAPCYKLNHRFEVKDMAKRTQTLFRTGWLYRIIKSGTIAAGDTVRLLERPHPDWTVARVEYYLFLETDNVEKMKEIVEIPHLGWEIKDKFHARLAKGTTEDQNGRMYGDPADAMDAWYECRVISKHKESSTVLSFTLETIDPPPSSSQVDPGSHVRLKLGGKLVRAYSVTGGTTGRFSLGIALSPNSRGGSKYLHENVHVGSVITASRITSSFPLAPTADTHVIIAGGIGITAFLAALHHLQQTKQEFHLHYAVAAEVPFQEKIAEIKKECVTIYNRSEGRRMDLKHILGHADSRTHIYTCGPTRLMDAVVATAKSLHISDKQVHMEQFTVTTSGDPFTAELKASNKVVEVGASQTLLDVLREVGMDVDSSCEVGNCGTCRVDVVDGRVEHRGTGLLEEEKCGAMLACVSRGVGRIVLDL